jgi:hypothetical protein
MIFVRIMGGLGNQMFQYAAARRLALACSTDVALDLGHFTRRHGWHTDRAYQLHHFRLPERRATAAEVLAHRGMLDSWWSRKTFKLRRRLNPHLTKHYREETGLAFDPAVLAYPDGSYLKGFWLDERYFKDQEATIRADFAFKHAAPAAVEALAERIRAVNAVSIHVRRGDYVNNPRYRAQMAQLDEDHYRRAIAHIRAHVPDAVFVVFSDDIAWVKANLPLPDGTIHADVNGPDHGYEDLRLMSQCRHHIIANSTFSWWGAWLNPRPDKIVVAPSRWYANPEPGFGIIPPTWTVL